MAEPFDVRVQIIYPPGIGGVGGVTETVTLPKTTVEVEAIEPFLGPSLQTQKSLVKRAGATAYTLGELLIGMTKERRERLALELALEAITPEVAEARLGTAGGGSKLG